MPIDKDQATGRIIVQSSEALAYFLASSVLAERSAPGGFQDLLREALERRRELVPSAADLLDLLADLRSERLVGTVSPERILALETGERPRDQWSPRHSLLRYWILDPGPFHRTALEDLVRRLNRTSPEISQAYAEPRYSSPSAFWPDSAQVGVAEQGYLKPRPRGINAMAAWKKGFIGIPIHLANVDLTWNLNHEDLKDRNITLVGCGANYSSTNGDCQVHGTNALGVVVALDNEVGIVGIAPGIKAVRVGSRYRESGDQSAVSTAIYELWDAQAMGAGDVLLLEVETASHHPAEVIPDVWDAIFNVANNGIVVIEPAGNGNRDLDQAPSNVSGWPDSPQSSSNPPEESNPRNPSQDDSGAIMVGAAAVPAMFPPGFTAYNRLTSKRGSNHGKRVDCFAWGGSVYTTGSDIPPCNASYSGNFGRTSAAAAIVAGAAILAQDMQLSVKGLPLDSRRMRELLREPSLGTPSNDPIGMMPDLGLMAAHLGAGADVYVRDSLSDQGTVPSPVVSMSPDVFVLRGPNPPLAAQFDEASGTANQMIANAVVQDDAENYIYVRMRNRGSEPTFAKARVYWSEPSTLITPSQWKPILPVSPMAQVLVPADDTLVVYGPIQWDASDSANRPAGTHACLLAIADGEEDEGPDLATIGTLADFKAFVGQENNLAWRNFNLLTVPADAPDADPFQGEAFFFAGFEGEEASFDFRAFSDLPETACLWLHVPEPARHVLVERPTGEVTLDPAADALPIAPEDTFVRSVRLGEERIPCSLRLESDNGLPEGEYHVHVCQLHQGVELGRITWHIRATAPR